MINVVTEKLSPGPGEKRFSATWLKYGGNEQTVTFAVGDEWDVDEGVPIEESYEILWAREYRYDQARARYLYRVLDPGELQEDPPNFVGTDTWSQYHGDEIYSDYTIDGQTVTVTDWYEPGIGKVEDVSGTPVVKYYHDDLIGTTRFMTDADGNRIEGAVYTAFGELVSGDPRRFGYAGAYGYQTDVRPDSTPAVSDMPFLHVGVRYYDPSTGRFLQRDPIGIIGGWNVYGYVLNIPTLLVDADGLQIPPPSTFGGPTTGQAATGAGVAIAAGAAAGAAPGAWGTGGAFGAGLWGRKSLGDFFTFICYYPMAAYDIIFNVAPKPAPKAPRKRIPTPKVPCGGAGNPFC